MCLTKYGFVNDSSYFLRDEGSTNISLALISNFAVEHSLALAREMLVLRFFSEVDDTFERVALAVAIPTSRTRSQQEKTNIALILKGYIPLIGVSLAEDNSC